MSPRRLHPLLGLFSLAALLLLAACAAPQATAPTAPQKAAESAALPAQNNATPTAVAKPSDTPAAKPAAAAPTPAPAAPKTSAGQGQGTPQGQGATAKGSGQGSGSGGYQGAFQGLGELSVAQAAVKYRADLDALKAQVKLPSDDPYASITALQGQGLDKAALQTALNSLGRIQNPDTKALEQKRQADFDALVTAAHPHYKAALVGTNQKNVEASTKGVTEMARLWQDISDLYGVTPPPAFAGDKQWGADVAQILTAVDEARTAITAGDLVKGHEALEPVRETLLEVRTRNNAQVFEDQLTIFHSAMEAVSAPTTNKTADTLTAADVDAVKAAYPKMADAFKLIEQPPAGKFSAEQAKGYSALIQSEAATIAALDAALNISDKAGIVKAAADLKTTFSKLFAQYG